MRDVIEYLITNYKEIAKVIYLIKKEINRLEDKDRGINF